MREGIEQFDFDNTGSPLDEAGLLFQVLERFKRMSICTRAKSTTGRWRRSSRN
jgi:hypothetical protein